MFQGVPAELVLQEFAKIRVWCEMRLNLRRFLGVVSDPVTRCPAPSASTPPTLYDEQGNSTDENRETTRASSLGSSAIPDQRAESWRW